MPGHDGDPRNYLETDGRIIAESDTYIAIALRIDKQLLARNLPLLAALADILPKAFKAIFPVDS